MVVTPVAVTVIGGGGGGGGGICPVEGVSETGGVVVVDGSWICEGEGSTGVSEIDSALDLSIESRSVDSDAVPTAPTAEEVVLWGRDLPSLGFRSCCSS